MLEGRHSYVRPEAALCAHMGACSILAHLWMTVGLGFSCRPRAGRQVGGNGGTGGGAGGHAGRAVHILTASLGCSLLVARALLRGGAWGSCCSKGAAVLAVQVVECVRGVACQSRKQCVVAVLRLLLLLLLLACGMGCGGRGGSGW